jgi:hypothetical protein
LVGAIEKGGGIVKAISNNKLFIDAIAKIKIGNTPSLMADVLHYLEN